MIRCVRLWTGDDQNSHFEEGRIDLGLQSRGDVLSVLVSAATISFQETASGGSFAWHTAPARQLVITLSGTLNFETRHGERFQLHPGDILFAEDTAGGGHKWQLADEQPWRRAYVVLKDGAPVPFIAGKR
jgi:quercetin dioxygenase-like cupin family protein